jgi:hypothetical protein
MNETDPSTNPEIIDHIPSDEELRSARPSHIGLDSRLEHTLTRGALRAISEGATEDAATLNAMHPAKRSTGTDVALTEQAPLERPPSAPEPYVPSEIDRTLRGDELQALREQANREDK